MSYWKIVEEKEGVYAIPWARVKRGQERRVRVGSLAVELNKIDG